MIFRTSKISSRLMTGLRRGTRNLNRKQERFGSHLNYVYPTVSSFFILYPVGMKSAVSMCEAEPFREIKGKEVKVISSLTQMQNRAWQYLRMLLRTIQLVFLLAPPGLLLYPLIYSEKNLPDWYLKWCLRCVETSGAAVIKLMQWASGRPDVFGNSFCEVFKRLQDDTTPHAFEHTVLAMEGAYGKEWRGRIRLGDVIGSGCIGQVYRGFIVRGEKEQEVAIKVRHPNICKNMDSDLDILALLAHVAEHVPFGIGKKLQWYDIPGAVEEFTKFLSSQLDFRTEAQNLKTFNKCFEGDTQVVFPQLIQDFHPHQDVLIETYCHGEPIMKFAKNCKDQATLTDLCEIGIRTVSKMIFIHNFVHGDIHPGNIMVSHDGKQIILLDAGIAVTCNNHDHDLVVGIVASFIRGEGRRAAKLLMEDSNRRLRLLDTNERAKDENAYIEKINNMCVEAFGDENYLMLELGTYISDIFQAASDHHVMINKAFVNLALAIKIQEGIVLSLDKELEIW